MSKNKKNIIIVCAIATLMLIGTAVAYFTDMDSKDNNFIVGNIDIELTEPNWNPDNGDKITPDQIIAKDPTVTNIGANDAYVFLQIEVPVANVRTVNDDGTVNAAAKTELFSYSLNDGWTQVSKSDAADKVTYVYAYTSDGQMNPLSPEGSATIFENVKFANIVEGELTDNNLNIGVDMYAIQADNLKTAAPLEVFNLILNENK